jgi:cation diffusion facilitator CzcD-associated flavoprotein CzcO
MAPSSSPATPAPPGDVSRTVDAVVIGAGFSGLYATKRLLDLGLTVAAFDAADGPGGVWRWNGYPGAQTDSPQSTYRFTFADDLEAEWEYTRKFPRRQEVLGYLRHVADQYGLTRHYTFGTRVETAQYLEESGTWVVTTDSGEAVRAQYVVTGLGLVSEPFRPDFPGLETFAGEILYTSLWPDKDVELEGKRIAIIGTGSSGIQLVPNVARVARELTVFQRTPNYVVPTGNRPVDDDDRAELRDRYPDIARRVRNHPAAFPFERTTGRLAVGASEAERNAIFEQMWQRGGFSLLYESFDDVASDPVANQMLCDFIRGKIRSIVGDPAIAEALCPSYPYGAKRPPTGDGYYESFNLPRVSLVDIRTSPIQEVTPRGIRTANGHVHLDVIIFATGFDVATGSFLRMDIRGRGGRSLREHWANGPSTYLGVAISGYPNFFMVAGPQSPFANLPPGAEGAGDWIASLIGFMRDRDIRALEPSERAENDWNHTVADVASASFVLQSGFSVNSWFTGANIEGKARAFNVYFGGQDDYLNRLEAEALKGYPGFACATEPVGAASPGDGAAHPALPVGD